MRQLLSGSGNDLRKRLGFPGSRHMLVSSQKCPTESGSPTATVAAHATFPYCRPQWRSCKLDLSRGQLSAASIKIIASKFRKCLSQNHCAGSARLPLRLGNAQTLPTPLTVGRTVVPLTDYLALCLQSASLKFSRLPRGPSFGCFSQSHQLLTDRVGS